MAGPIGCVRSNQCESVVKRAKVFSRQFCAGIENRQGPQWLAGVLRHNRLCPRFSIVTIILAREQAHTAICIVLYGTQLYPHCTPTLQYVSHCREWWGGPMIQQQGLLWVGLKNSKSTKRCVTISGNQQSQVSTGYHRSIVSRINIGLVRSCFAHECE